MQQNFTLTLGDSCPDGSLVRADFDEKNLTTDWLEEFLFDYNCVKSRHDGMICGFVELDEYCETTCLLTHTGNTALYEFVDRNYLGMTEILAFKDMLEKFLFECDNLTIHMHYEEMESQRPYIRLSFFSRYED